MDKKGPMHGLYRNAVSYFGGMLIIISLVLILLKKEYPKITWRTFWYRGLDQDENQTNSRTGA